MKRTDIVELSSYRNPLCVSIVARTHRKGSETKQDPLVVKNLVKEAEQRLLDAFDQRDVEPVMERINALVEDIDWANTQDGLLLFASDEFSLRHAVPYPVRSRVVIDETFATRDLLFTMSRSPHYRVLVLSEKPTRLFEAYRDSLDEVENEDFPIRHTGPGGDAPLPGGRGINVSQYRDEKHREFFREVDEGLGKLQALHPLPLIVFGVDRYLAFFRGASAHAKDIVGTKEGSYDKASDSELAKLAWPIMEDHLESKALQALGQLEAAVSANRFASTVDEVWRAAWESRVQTLVVEVDFHFSAEVDENGYLVSEGGVSEMEDAVDELAELVLHRGGDIVFVPNGSLEKHQRIAATLRY